MRKAAMTQDAHMDLLEESYRPFGGDLLYTR